MNNKCGGCIYSCTCAKFPNLEIDPNLFIVVLPTMIYKPFGACNSYSLCMVEEKCYNDIFHIPNPFILEYLANDLDELL
jgi:hypothetical protein